MQKKFGIVAAGLLLSVTTLFADGQMKSKKTTTDKNRSQSPATTAPTFQQGDEGLMINQYPAAYNKAGAICVNQGWDVFIDASFIYWNAQQSNMDLARSAALNAADPTPVHSSSILHQKVNYNPGFKVGLGFNFNYDDWVGSIEYTRLHQTTTTSSNAPKTSIASGPGSGVWDPTSWFDAVNAPLQFSHIHSSWHLNMDMIDANLSRPFYQGRQLTILPYMGLRALFLHQKLNIRGINALNTTTPPLTSNNSSKCWSLGPNVGANVHWILGLGFRLEGFAGGSLLYTRYTRVAHQENDQGLDVAGANPAFSGKTHFSAVRPVANAGLGMGWGGYCCEQRYHFDLSARYDFMVAWSQGVMRELVSIYSPATQGTWAGDLQIHGLTVSARFDF
jgi:hypothetical protein